MKRMSKILMPLILILALTVTGCTMGESNSDGTMHASAAESVVSLDEVPEYGGDPYVVVNDNEPSFSKIDLQSASFEEYSDLDNLGRCGTAFANIGRDLMPTEKRGSIGSVKPSGWKTVKYDNVDGKYLYNRCHLIGYQLTAENANEKNLITGTRYMNVEGMLPFENLVADYIKETNNHVLYRGDADLRWEEPGGKRRADGSGICGGRRRRRQIQRLCLQQPARHCHRLCHG